MCAESDSRRSDVKDPRSKQSSSSCKHSPFPQPHQNSTMASRDSRILCPLCDIDCIDVQRLSKHLLAAHKHGEDTLGDLSYGLLCGCGKALRRLWAYHRHPRAVHDRQPLASQKEVHIEWSGTGPNWRGRAVEQYHTASARDYCERDHREDHHEDHRAHRSRNRRSPDRAHCQGYDHWSPPPKRRREDNRGRQSPDGAARRREAERRHDQASRGALAQREVFSKRDFLVQPAASRGPGVELGSPAPTPLAEESDASTAQGQATLAACAQVRRGGSREPAVGRAIALKSQLRARRRKRREAPQGPRPIPPFHLLASRLGPV